MAIKHYDITLAATATPITSTVATRKGILQVILQSENGNSSAYVGDSTVTASTYGQLLAADEELTIGPFIGAAPLSTGELYIFGTTDDIIHAIVITH